MFSPPCLLLWQFQLSCFITNMPIIPSIINFFKFFLRKWTNLLQTAERNVVGHYREENRNKAESQEQDRLPASMRIQQLCLGSSELSEAFQ
jgi:hypothetical protein